MGTVMVMAFIYGDLFPFFPFKKSFEAIGTEVFNGFTKAVMKLKDVVTDFAFELRAFFSVIIINIRVWS
jgi:hypothetical protein